MRVRDSKVRVKLTKTVLMSASLRAIPVAIVRASVPVVTAPNLASFFYDKIL
ncbi:hypothetical protein LINGRAHAP2_LOCUS30342 [Linum grandiflorum]